MTEAEKRQRNRVIFEKFLGQTKCTSCGVPIAAHMGLIVTCKEVQRLREALEEARGTMRCARYMKTSLVLSACLGAGIKEINDVLKDQPDPYITQMEATDD